MPKPLPSGLQVRQAGPDDVPSLAVLLSLAPDDGSLYRFPHILEHSDEMRALHVGWLRPGVHDPTTLIRIAVVPAEGNDKVVGFTSWTRRETDPEDQDKTRPAQLAEVAIAQDAEQEPETSSSTEAPQKPQALVPNQAHSDAVKRVRKRTPPSPTATTPCYELGSLAIHPDYQGHGIGSLLARWGLDKAAEEHVPVFVTGEARGVDFYENALGFQRLRSTEFWLDKEGCDISREEALGGNEAWKKENGGLSGAQMVWLPAGNVLELDGEVYKGE